MLRLSLSGYDPTTDVRPTSKRPIPALLNGDTYRSRRAISLGRTQPRSSRHPTCCDRVWGNRSVPRFLSAQPEPMP
jgi:hypothetical protein